MRRRFPASISDGHGNGKADSIAVGAGEPGRRMTQRTAFVSAPTKHMTLSVRSMQCMMKLECLRRKREHSEARVMRTAYATMWQDRTMGVCHWRATVRCV